MVHCGGLKLSLWIDTLRICPVKLSSSGKVSNGGDVHV